MRRVAFLSTDNLEGFYIYDDLLVLVFAEHDWHVETVSWRDSTVNWQRFDAVIVRSTWDYQDEPEAFKACLTHISQHVPVLENPLPLMLWNMQKDYLKELEKQGVDVIPTQWLPNWCERSIRAHVLGSHHEWIIKPTLSANADNTFRLSANTLSAHENALETIFADRPLMLQPFVSSVVETGEYSLFYFDGELSHAILKQPASGDFRVQEEHGGLLSVATPSADMILTADKTLALMPHSALYARVDLVLYEHRWRVMELELIEPSLYFQLDDNAAERFVQAFLRRVDAKGRA